MKAFQILSICLTAVFILVSCKPETNVADAKKEIEEADARQVQAFQTKDITGLTANYSEDAVILPQNGPMVSGSENINAFFQEMSGMTSDFTFSMNIFDASGDLAYEVGTYSGKFGGMEDKGKYVTVWKRQPDGTWKIAADIFNTDLPPSTQTTE